MIEGLACNIEQVHARDFKGYATDKPLLIKEGVTFFFPRLASWTKDYLSKSFGDVQVKVSRDSRPVLGNAGKRSLASFFEENDETLYAFDLCSFTETSKTPMASDLSFPNPLFSRDEIKRTVFFAGDEGLGASPHAHGQAFNLLTSGSKLWAFWDARTEEGEDLVSKTAASFSESDKPGSWWTSTDFANFPVPLTIGLQEAGDIILVPSKFAHTVRNGSYTIGLVCICADPIGLDKFNDALYKNRSEKSSAKVPIAVVDAATLLASGHGLLNKFIGTRSPLIIRDSASVVFPKLHSHVSDTPSLSVQSFSLQVAGATRQHTVSEDAVASPNALFTASSVQRVTIQEGTGGVSLLPRVINCNLVDAALKGQKHWVMWDSTTESGKLVSAAFSNTTQDEWAKVDLDAMNVPVYEGIQGQNDIIFVPAGFTCALTFLGTSFTQALVELN